MDMIKVVITAVLISFGISAVACPVLIPFLKKIKFGQQVTRGWTAGTSEEAGNADDGRYRISLQCDTDVSFLYEILPQIIPILFMNGGIWICRFPG